MLSFLNQLLSVKGIGKVIHIWNFPLYNLQVSKTTLELGHGANSVNWLVFPLFQANTSYSILQDYHYLHFLQP